MTNRKLDVVAIGACYVDTNVASFPFNRKDIVSEELIGEEYEIVPGGSAVNFCRLGHELGLQAAFIGMAGSDVIGDTLENLLRQQGVQSDLVRRPDLLTNIGFNLTNSRGEHVMFVAGTANGALNPEAILPKLEQILPDADMLYLGGCFKLKAFARAFGEIVSLANQYGTKIAIDHGRIHEGVSDVMLKAVKDLVLQATYYFPSREEFCDLWNISDIAEGLDNLQSQAPGLTVIVKDGANGAFYWAGGSKRHQDAEKVEKVFNATGAGDSFNAGVITALTKDNSLESAVAYGCRVAAAKIKAESLPRL